MEVSLNPPDFWAETIEYPCQTAEFADSMRALGYRPFYCWDEKGRALIQFRGRGPLGRAYVQISGESTELISSIVGYVRDQGIPFVRFGNTIWGLEHKDCEIPSAVIVSRHTFTLDLASLKFESLSAEMRRRVRKSERGGVSVERVENENDLKIYWKLSKETSERMLKLGYGTVLPFEFFRSVWDKLGSKGLAQMYLSRYNDIPVACGMFLGYKKRVVYYQGGSVRDSSLNHKEGTPLLLWKAMVWAKEAGLETFDLGGCTIGLTESDPRHGIYRFKQAWGGELKEFCNLEVIVRPAVYRLQQSVMLPLWTKLRSILRLGG